MYVALPLSTFSALKVLQLKSCNRPNQMRKMHSSNCHHTIPQNIEQFDDIGPCVIMASPGMMQSGLSRQLFEAWCTDKRNGLIVAGYCVEGTLAKVRA